MARCHSQCAKPHEWCDEDRGHDGKEGHHVPVYCCEGIGIGHEIRGGERFEEEIMIINNAEREVSCGKGIPAHPQAGIGIVDDKTDKENCDNYPVGFQFQKLFFQEGIRRSIRRFAFIV